MAVKLRLKRFGKRHRPFFRLNAVEVRTPRDGKVLEKLGHYDPLEPNGEKQIVVQRERVLHWLNAGATCSETVSQILLRCGIKHKQLEKKKARRERAKAIARKQGRFFTQAEKVAAEKAAEQAKAQAEAEAKAEQERLQAEAKAKEKAAQEQAKAEEAEAKQAQAEAEENQAQAETAGEAQAEQQGGAGSDSEQGKGGDEKTQ